MLLFSRLRPVEGITIYTQVMLHGMDSQPLNIVHQILHDLEVSTGMLDKELDAFKNEVVAPSRTKGKSLRFYMS